MWYEIHPKLIICSIFISSHLVPIISTNVVYPSDIYFKPLHSKGKFSCQVNKSPEDVHKYLELANLSKMSTNNPNQKSVALESVINQALAAKLAIMAWFDRIFKNHSLVFQYFVT